MSDIGDGPRSLGRGPWIGRPRGYPRIAASVRRRFGVVLLGAVFGSAHARQDDYSQQVVEASNQRFIEQ
ncbi:MAG: hypothetical protein ACYTE2_02325, partial [Planctomycetota bacterium]